jgi:DnaA-homolog protein
MTERGRRHAQLPLPVQLRPEANFSEYLPGPNSEAVAAVAAWVAGLGEPFIYLFGPPGTGKTHLLHATCHQASRTGKSIVYVPLGEPGLSPSVLTDLEAAQLIALDDVHTVAGDQAWELGLFDLFNRVRAARRCLLVSGQAAISDLALGLADLRSRLGWGPGYRLRPLGEKECEQLLREAAQRRGLQISPDLSSYIMRRCRRDPGALLDLLNRLDEKSLREKRRPTVHLVRELIEPPG